MIKWERQEGGPVDDPVKEGSVVPGMPPEQDSVQSAVNPDRPKRFLPIVLFLKRLVTRNTSKSTVENSVGYTNSSADQNQGGHGGSTGIITTRQGSQEDYFVRRATERSKYGWMQSGLEPQPNIWTPFRERHGMVEPSKIAIYGATVIG